MPRFVILEHDHPILHWDLMLEEGFSLKTWRLAEPPGGAQPIDATELGDHRAVYLDYEGPVSGGRGFVKRWDAGAYEDIGTLPDQRSVRFDGARLRGLATLTRIADMHWRFDLITAT
jgi:hypothetical protein